MLRRFIADFKNVKSNITKGHYAILILITQSTTGFNEYYLPT